jgi:hypothetical protein
MEKFNHPSFGKISISKSQSSGNMRFYGTDLPQSTFYTLRIHSSSLEKSVHRDYYSDEKSIIEVRLTPLQFSEMITTMNTTGTPCTIAYRDGKKVEELPKILSSKEFILNEFEETTKTVRNSFREIENEINSILNKLPKKDQELLKSKIWSMGKQIDDVMPYLLGEFQERVDAISAEAKNVITNHIQEQAQQNGLLGENIDLKFLE